MLPAAFDVHKLSLISPLGMDPCQTIEQKLYAIKNFHKIEKLHAKQVNRSSIMLGSETEGIFREKIPMEEIEVPRPQANHCFCQICAVQFEDFDQHIQTESHLRRAKNQA